MENISIEYLAGFFDGEGCIGVYPSKNKKGYKTYNLVLTVGQIEPIVIRKLHGKYGGSLRFDERSKKIKNRQDAWYWHISGRKAERFLRDVFPYLIVKRSQAELALAYMGERIKVGHNYAEYGRENPGPKYHKVLKAMKRGEDVTLQ